MVFFLNAQEHKYLINHLLPLAREVGVSQELRGWSWWKEPLKPYYKEYISMFSVCGKFCPSARDVYLMYIERKEPALTRELLLGASGHNMLEYIFSTLKREEEPDWEGWWREEVKHRGRTEHMEFLKNTLKPLWDLTTSSAKASILEVQSTQPYADRQQVISIALPFLIEHKLDGRLLGLSGTLSLDCYDYLRHLVFDVKIGGTPKDFYRIYPVGYALVFESLYEVPVDIGCSVHVGFRDGRVEVRRDLFFMGDDLRSWWVEERDKKLEIVANRRDPGKATQCPPNCPFQEVCL
ncbi:MAG: type I-A CRISPR-associated protein Cas4/Csa1 [Candidatus Hadarchaeales archaeon]